MTIISTIIEVVILLIVIWGFERIRAFYVSKRPVPHIVRDESETDPLPPDGGEPTQHQGHHGNVSHDGGAHHGGHDGGFGGDFGGGHGH